MRYSFSDESAGFEIAFIHIDAAQTIYNADLEVAVCSHGFSGKSDWTVHSEDIKAFIPKLHSLYETLREGEAELIDREYGSRLNIHGNGQGHFRFSGTLADGWFQKLEFEFSLDQTYLRRFVRDLYADFCAGTLFG